MIKDFIIYAIIIRLILALILLALYLYGSYRQPKSKRDEEEFSKASITSIMFAEAVIVFTMMIATGKLFEGVGMFGITIIEKISNLILKKEKVK
ncbi:MAG: hypothetical protein ACRCX2_35165 [Paraclostridium sp.]